VGGQIPKTKNPIWKEAAIGIQVVEAVESGEFNLFDYQYS